MLYKLRGSKEELTVSSTMWDQLLSLARKHGWEPAGTLPPGPLRPGTNAWIPSRIPALYEWAWSSGLNIGLTSRRTIWNPALRSLPSGAGHPAGI